MKIISLVRVIFASIGSGSSTVQVGVAAGLLDPDGLQNFPLPIVLLPI